MLNIPLRKEIAVPKPVRTRGTVFANVVAKLYFEPKAPLKRALYPINGLFPFISMIKAPMIKATKIERAKDIM